MHESFLFALIALIGVFLGAGGLIAASLSSAVFQGVRRAWPLLAMAVLYGLAFLIVPPVPLQHVISRTGLSAWDAVRYAAFGIGFAVLARDYFKALCQLHRLQERAA